MKCFPLAFSFRIGVARTSSGSRFSLTSCDDEEDDVAGALAVVAPDADAGDLSPFFLFAEVVLDVDADISPRFFVTEVALDADARDESPFFFVRRFGFFALSFLLLSPSV